MPVPTKTFTAIADSKIDVDSPLTTELMTWLRDNIEHLEEWLGKDYAAAQNHNHDGLNSAPVQTSGGLEARLFAQAAALFIPVDSLGYGPWTTVYELTNIWMPHGVVGLHVKGDLARTGNVSSDNVVEFKMQIEGPGGTDDSNILTSPSDPETFPNQVFDLTLSDANMNAEVTHRIVARYNLVDYNIATASFDPTPSAYTWWHHFG